MSHKSFKKTSIALALATMTVGFSYAATVAASPTPPNSNLTLISAPAREPDPSTTGHPEPMPGVTYDQPSMSAIVLTETTPTNETQSDGEQPKEPLQTGTAGPAPQDSSNAATNQPDQQGVAPATHNQAQADQTQSDTGSEAPLVTSKPKEETSTDSANPGSKPNDTTAPPDAPSQDAIVVNKPNPHENTTQSENQNPPGTEVTDPSKNQQPGDLTTGGQQNQPNDSVAPPEAPSQNGIVVKEPNPLENQIQYQNEVAASPMAQSYTNMQYQAARVARTASQDFTQQAQRFLVADNMVHAYVGYNHDYTSMDYLGMDGEVSPMYSGTNTVNGVTVGAYSQMDSINYGLALTYNSNKFTTNMGEQQVADATVKSTGLTFTASQAFADMYVGGSLYGYYHKNQAQRGSDEMMLTSKFTGNQLGASVTAGYRAYQDNMSSVVLTGSLVAERNAHKGFMETGADAMADQALAVQKNSHVDAYAQLGASYKLNMPLASLMTQLEAGVSVEQALTKNKFKLKLADGSYTNPAVAKKLVTTLNLAYTVNFTKAMAVQVAGSYETNGNWDNRAVGVNFKYGF